MKTLTEQYVNFWFVISELPADAEDTGEVCAFIDTAFAQIAA
jgi:hypothetical protein